jgi:acyl-phosphate glycerol 3-phosphate acyltransferase
VNSPSNSLTLVLALAALAVLAAYVVGSIPFGYLLTRAIKGIDIRTVGSGNLGATNVGRVLGFRYFLLVLALDALKGFLPTLCLPLIVKHITASAPPDLPVLVALAAVLGHTFPIFLRFRGGKGVATSLGVLLALDPVSCAVAAVVFGGVLLVSRYVSLSSLVAAAAFAVAHFVRQPSPCAREHIAMSLLACAIPGLLFWRHRSNLARIWAGTESRVTLRKPTAPSRGGPHSPGRAALWAVVGLLVLTPAIFGAVYLYQHATQVIELSAGPWFLRETDRASTGQQRVDRVAFGPGGDRLAATCPRYESVVIYEIAAGKKLTLLKEIELEGRPEAVVALADRFMVLERPSGDQRHVAPGWWETFDRDGKRVGPRTIAGYYPDDLAASPDGKYLYVVSSGRSEGDPKKPLPSLEVVALDSGAASGRTVGRLDFEADADPARFMLSASGRCAAVLLAKTNECAAIDLSIPMSPRLIGRTKLPRTDVPYISYSGGGDWILMPVAGQSEALALNLPAAGARSTFAGDSTPAGGADYLVCARQRESVLEIFQCAPRHSLGRYPLKGPLNLSRTRPTGLSYSPERGLLAVATRSGTIHLIELVSRVGPAAVQLPEVATSRSERSVR